MSNASRTQQSPAAAEPSSSSILDSLTHKYGLRDELDGTGAVKPRELICDGGRAAVDGADEELPLTLRSSPSHQMSISHRRRFRCLLKAHA
jgi:hypothetical protein